MGINNQLDKQVSKESAHLSREAEQILEQNIGVALYEIGKKREGLGKLINTSREVSKLEIFWTNTSNTLKASVEGIKDLNDQESKLQAGIVLLDQYLEDLSKNNASISSKSLNSNEAKAFFSIYVQAPEIVSEFIAQFAIKQLKNNKVRKRLSKRAENELHKKVAMIINPMHMAPPSGPIVQNNIEEKVFQYAENSSQECNKSLQESITHQLNNLPSKIAQTNSKALSDAELKSEFADILSGRKDKQDIVNLSDNNNSLLLGCLRLGYPQTFEYLVKEMWSQ